MNKQLEALSKPYWFPSDIENYLGCSKSLAVEIKNIVVKKYGCIDAHEFKEHQAVKADYVIQLYGGKSREEELRILRLVKELNMINEVENLKLTEEQLDQMIKEVDGITYETN